MAIRAVLATGVCLLALSGVASAQGRSPGPEQAQAQQDVRGAGDRGDASGRPGSLGSIQSSAASRPVATEISEALPYGSSLFDAPTQVLRSDGADQDYVITTGDRLAIRIWGAVSFDQIVAVDSEGKVFIPDAGPVVVSGRRAADVEDVIRAKVRSIYTSNVEVYATLLTAMPVPVFVSGGVASPGEYAGLPADSVLSFLRKAGGIDPRRGSYRKVDVLRRGKKVLSVDLYRFLSDGAMPVFRFERGDVVLVQDRGPVTVVEGVARSPFGFELNDAAGTGRILMDLAKPLPSASHALVTGIRSGKPFTHYGTLAEFARFELRDGDRVSFESDLRDEVIKVRIEGVDHLGPSVFAVPRDTRLGELLDNVAVDGQAADLRGIHIRRKSVVQGQRKLIEESLRRLEESVLTGPASSDGEATIRMKEAELVMQFIERARGVEPEGRVVVSRGGRISDLRLEADDVVVIPSRTDVVLIAGEVLLPQAVVYERGMSLDDYISRAGGMSERADGGRIALLHSNGEVEMGSASLVMPGDRVLVLPSVDVKSMQIAKDIVQVIYQIAVSAAVALSL